jgi:hypothetical protein
MPSPRVTQLDQAGIVKALQVTPEAQAVIDNLTDAEFQAILSVFPKIAPAKKPQYSQTIQVLGF